MRNNTHIIRIDITFSKCDINMKHVEDSLLNINLPVGFSTYNNILSFYAFIKNDSQYIKHRKMLEEHINNSIMNIDTVLDTFFVYDYYNANTDIDDVDITFNHIAEVSGIASEYNDERITLYCTWCPDTEAHSIVKNKKGEGIYTVTSNDRMIFVL